MYTCRHVGGGGGGGGGGVADEELISKPFLVMSV